VTTPAWLLLDYGGVVCQHQPEQARAALVGAAGREAEPFWAAYWAHRGPYDAGSLSSTAYWCTVADTVGASWPDELCGELTRIDVDGWLHPDEDVLRLARDAKAGGLRLALLSNAPADLASAVRGLSWMAPFDELIFSCDLGTVKPDAGCYRAALGILGAEPAEVLFVDDRQENVDGAHAVGIPAVRFTDAAGLRDALARALRPASLGRGRPGFPSISG
jgi:putative hydrolase of the HAD superfamily